MFFILAMFFYFKKHECFKMPLCQHQCQDLNANSVLVCLCLCLTTIKFCQQLYFLLKN